VKPADLQRSPANTSPRQTGRLRVAAGGRDTQDNRRERPFRRKCHPKICAGPNGLRLLLKEDHRLPFVEFRAVFKGGVLAETPATNGLTQLMAKMLLQGTRRRSAEQIATEIESLGGGIDSFGGNNSFGVSAEVLAGDFGQDWAWSSTWC